MKLERLIAILTALLQTDRIPASWFAERFEVSIRTIYRDIEALENAGIPIVTHTGLKGGISILDTYKIDKKLFTHQDITTLLTSLHSVSGSMASSQINQTLEKIKGLVPEEHSQAIELSSRQLYIDTTPWASSPVVTDNLALLQRALASNEVVRFHYHDRYQSSTLRTAEPHQLVLKEGSWYLKAFCRSRQAFSTFKLSRMGNTELLNESFTPREFESGMKDFKDWQHEGMVTVELVADQRLRERALDFCRPEYLSQRENGRLHITMPFVESDMGYGVLLSFGQYCEVLSPPHIKKELARRIRLMESLYPED